MEAVVGYLSIDYVVLRWLGFELSLLELLAITSGLVSVYWATTMDTRTWVSGLVNEALFFLVFYQVQLYSEMLLQVFFALSTIYGLHTWKKTSSGPRTPLFLKRPQRTLFVACIIVTTIALGATMSSIHEVLPSCFPKPAAAPYVDGFTAAASIVATILMAHRAIDTWFLWISIDIVSILLYIERKIPFMALLYCIFFMLALRGYRSWRMLAKDA